MCIPMGVPPQFIPMMEWSTFRSRISFGEEGQRFLGEAERLMMVVLAAVPLLSPKGHVHVHVFALPLLVDCFMRLRARPFGHGLCIAAIFAITMPVWTGLTVVNQLPVWIQQMWYSRFALITTAGIVWALWHVSEGQQQAVPTAA